MVSFATKMLAPYCKATVQFKGTVSRDGVSTETTVV
jgi:hypothetical protein